MARYRPDELCKHVEEIATQSGLKAFVVDRAHKRHREMWCAGQFASGYVRNFEMCEVEIEDADEQADFDFKLCINNEQLLFQIAEVMEDGFRRGDQYRNLDEEGIRTLNSSVPRISAEVLGELVYAAVEKKLKKYGRCPDLHLLLYVNLHAPSAPWALLSGACGCVVESFASVWVHTQHAIICLHGGNRWVGEIRWRAI